MGTSAMLVRTIGVWIATAAIYVFLAGDVSAVELVAAAVCATAATGLALELRAVGQTAFRLLPAAPALLAPLGSMVPETARVGRALACATLGGAQGHSKLRRQPFEPGGNNATDAGRRAAAVIGLSLAPQSFVVREEEGALLMHDFPPRSASQVPGQPA